MADVRPLRGVRFDPAVVGGIGQLLAPPYDVSNHLATASEYAISQIENSELGLPGDQHAIAARRYRDWRQQGVLKRDHEPSIYLHRHRFTAHGVPFLRTSLIARVRLTDWSERVVLPHEQTMPGPRAERLERLRAVGANLSPLYFLFRDGDGTIRDLMADYAPRAHPAPEADRMGGNHELLPVTDPRFHRELAARFATRTLFVADGHHRYEAALTYRNQARAIAGEDPDAPSEFVLAMLAAVEDPGVLIRPAHRLVDGLPASVSVTLPEMLAGWFAVRPAAGPLPGRDHDGYITRLAVHGRDGMWDVTALPDGRHKALLAADRGPAWRSLGVAAVAGILERALSDNSGTAEVRVTYATDEDDALRRVALGSTQVAFLLPAPDLGQVLAVAEHGDLLPPKSTWFDPKAPAGLVINDLT